MDARRGFIGLLVQCRINSVAPLTEPSLENPLPELLPPVEAQEVEMMASAMASQSTGWNTNWNLVICSDFIWELVIVFFAAVGNHIRPGHRTGGGGAKCQHEYRRPHKPSREKESDQHTRLTGCIFVFCFRFLLATFSPVSLNTPELSKSLLTFLA